VLQVPVPVPVPLPPRLQQVRVFAVLLLEPTPPPLLPPLVDGLRVLPSAPFLPPRPLPPLVDGMRLLRLPVVALLLLLRALTQLSVRSLLLAPPYFSEHFPLFPAPSAPLPPLVDGLRLLLLPVPELRLRLLHRRAPVPPLVDGLRLLRLPVVALLLLTLHLLLLSALPLVRARVRALLPVALPLLLPVLRR
jgi:hypothetical protein